MDRPTLVWKENGENMWYAMRQGAEHERERARLAEGGERSEIAITAKQSPTANTATARAQQMQPLSHSHQSNNNAAHRGIEALKLAASYISSVNQPWGHWGNV